MSNERGGDKHGGPCVNADREIYREKLKDVDDYYADSIHVTERGGIGINCGGSVIVKPLREWFMLAAQVTTGAPLSHEAPSELAACQENLAYWKQLAESLGGVSAAARSSIEGMEADRQALSLLVEKLMFASYERGYQCCVDNIGRNDKGDSYNETLADREREAERALNMALHAKVREALKASPASATLTPNIESAITYAMECRADNIADFCDALRVYFSRSDGGAKP